MIEQTSNTDRGFSPRNLIFLCLSLIGCHHQNPAASLESRRAEPDQIKNSAIHLAEGPCFGTCPVYSITVYPNEYYRLESKQFTANPGTSSGTLPKGSFAAANAALRTAGFNHLPTEITQGNWACGGRIATDLPLATIGETNEIGTKTVNYYPGCVHARDKAALDILVSSLRSAFTIHKLINR